MNHEAFYDDRVIAAEREAIRLRKSDVNHTAIWLWPPFGPTEERERELTAPPPFPPLADYACQGMLQSACAQQAWGNHAMQNSVFGSPRRGPEYGLLQSLIGIGGVL